MSREWAHKLFRPETWYNLNMSLGFKRLQELIQVCCCDPSPLAALTMQRPSATAMCCLLSWGVQGCTSSLTDDPVWLLGLWYGLQDVDSNNSSMTPEVCAHVSTHSTHWAQQHSSLSALQA